MLISHGKGQSNEGGHLGAYLLTTAPSGQLDPALEQAWGFSWRTLVASPVHALALSPFLHWDPIHLCLNLVALIVFTGGLEYLAGSPLTLACYLAAALAANPMTAGLLELLRTVIPSINPAEIDVGASLGIFGCAGALAHFLRWGGGMIIVLSAGAIASAALIHGFLPLNHLFALAIGWGLARAILRD